MKKKVTFEQLIKKAIKRRVTLIKEEMTLMAQREKINKSLREVRRGLAAEDRWLCEKEETGWE